MDEWTFTVLWRICVCLIALALYTYVAYQFGKSKAEIFDCSEVDEEALAEAYNEGLSAGYASAIADVIKSQDPTWVERINRNEENKQG